MALLLFFVSTAVFSDAVDSDPLAYLFPKKTTYIGVNLGGGSTEWKYLVDTVDGTIPASVMSTPESVVEGGPSWGIVFGYDVTKNLAIEMEYTRFADANIKFSPTSRYVLIDHVSQMISKTQAYSLSGKFFAQVAHTRLRAFAGVGASLVSRGDVLARDNASSTNTTTIKTLSCMTPYMAAGLNYTAERHVLLESGFQYFTGFGQSEIHPVYGFVPFVWDAYFRLAYQF